MVDHLDKYQLSITQDPWVLHLDVSKKSFSPELYPTQDSYIVVLGVSSYVTLNIVIWHKDSGNKKTFFWNSFKNFPVTILEALQKFY